MCKSGIRLHIAQKNKFSIKDFFSKCDQICSFLWIWSHLLKKSLMVNFIFCAVTYKKVFCDFLLTFFHYISVITIDYCHNNWLLSWQLIISQIINKMQLVKVLHWILFPSKWTHMNTHKIVMILPEFSWKWILWNLSFVILFY